MSSVDDSSDSSSEMEPLIIQEDDGHSIRPRTDPENFSGFSFSSAHLKQAALMGPYLRQMDNLLKSCEEQVQDTNLSVTAADEKIMETTLTAADEKIMETTLTAADEKIMETTLTAADEKIMETTLTAADEKIMDTTLTAADEKIMETTLTAADEKIMETTLTAADEKIMDTTLTAADEKIMETTLTAADEKIMETTLTAADEKIMEDSAGEAHYLSTNYVDTRRYNTGTPGKSSGYRPADVPQKSDLPLTSIGITLSDNLVEYEEQLLEMLSMLEASVEAEQQEQEYVSQMLGIRHREEHEQKIPHWESESEDEVKQREGSGDDVEGSDFLTEPGTLLKNICLGSSLTEPGTLLKNICLGSSLTEPGTALKNICLGSSLTEPGTLLKNICLGSSLTEPGTALKNICLGSSLTEPGTALKNICLGSSLTEPGTALKNICLGSSLTEPGTALKNICLGSSSDELTALGRCFDECVEQVRGLETQRRSLLLKLRDLTEAREDGVELDQERELTEEQVSNLVEQVLKAVKKREEARREEKIQARHNLREERAREEQSVWKVSLERQELLDELRKQKKRLFFMTWECSQIQATLGRRQREVEEMKEEEDSLHSLLVQLTQESSDLRSSHQQQVQKVQDHLQRIQQTCTAAEETSESKRLSCGDVQQYLRGGLGALEERYQPVLMALYKRKEATGGALVEAKGQAQQLKVQLRPLKDEVQKLQFQRVSLEEKLKLSSLQRREQLGQYKETLTCLEEKSRELRTELMVQKRRRRDLEEMKERLTRQLQAFRTTAQGHA